MTVEDKANGFLAQGEKTLKKTSFFSFGSSSQRNEDACDLFEKAGNQFKIAKNCLYPSQLALCCWTSGPCTY